MIREKASDEELADYLEWAEAEHMGFGRFDTERGRKVVQSLRNLGPAPDTSRIRQAQTANGHFSHSQMKTITETECLRNRPMSVVGPFRP
jgi:hypothetical protein